MTPSGQMTVDMTTESSTPVQALDTANSATPEWPLTFSVHMIKIKGKSWQFLCMYAWVRVCESEHCSGWEASGQ